MVDSSILYCFLEEQFHSADQAGVRTQLGGVKFHGETVGVVGFKFPDHPTDQLVTQIISFADVLGGNVFCAACQLRNDGIFTLGQPALDMDNDGFASAQSALWQAIGYGRFYKECLYFRRMLAGDSPAMDLNTR